VLGGVCPVGRGDHRAGFFNRHTVAAAQGAQLLDLNPVRGLHHVPRDREVGGAHAWHGGHHWHSRAIADWRHPVRHAAVAVL
ncbi:hypothetical protein ABTP36_19825, partial [Acinetobacter baumannii]